MKKKWLPNRTGHVLSTGRALFSLGVGAIAATILCSVVGAFEPFALTLWDVGACVLLARLWAAAWPEGAEGTKRLAELEARRSTTDTAVLLATFASIAAVIVGLAESTNRTDNLRQLIIALSTIAVVLSWAMVNTVFAFKYARLYYFEEDGGIDFAQAEPPCYVDFAYVAFTSALRSLCPKPDSRVPHCDASPSRMPCSPTRSPRSSSASWSVSCRRSVSGSGAARCDARRHSLR